MNSHKHLLKTIDNKNRRKSYVCEHVYPELTSLCPISGLPDFYTLKLLYEPYKNLIELKSLKLYLTGYRNDRLYHEELANQILDEFIEVTNPNWALIELKVNVRGGIDTTIRRHYKKRKN
jgi:7-cyano-7-deazaguanine reductase